MTAINVVILAAGLGTRLGLAEPKPLTPINGKLSIVEEQLRKLDMVFPGHKTTIVVGHMADRFDFLSSRASLVLNPDYATTNTAKSLLIGIQATDPGGVFWLNGDVVFSPRVLELAKTLIEKDQSFSVVNEAPTSEEEMKYLLNTHGYIRHLSKEISCGLGESVGINYASSDYRHSLEEALLQVQAQDYFEEALNRIAGQSETAVFPLAISVSDALEIDSQSDLAEASHVFNFATSL